MVCRLQSSQPSSPPLCRALHSRLGSPETGEVELPNKGVVIVIPRVGGPHHPCERRAARSPVSCHLASCQWSICKTSLDARSAVSCSLLSIRYRLTLESRQTLPLRLAVSIPARVKFSGGTTPHTAYGPALAGRVGQGSWKRFNSIRCSSHSPNPKAPAISMCSG